MAAWLDLHRFPLAGTGILTDQFPPGGLCTTGRCLRCELDVAVENLFDMFSHVHLIKVPVSKFQGFEHLWYAICDL